MPLYRTHMLQSKECLKELRLKNEIDKDSFVLSSIAHDFLAFTNMHSTFVRAHSSNTNAFLIRLIEYIKENNLEENPKAMAFLYGQIMHYSLDVKTHPLIYYMTLSLNVKLVSPLIDAHTLFEIFLDDYMADKKINGLPKNVLLNDENINKIIDTIYEKVHNQKKASIGYKSGYCTMKVFNELIYLFNLKLINPINKYKPKETMLNLNNDVFLHPITGEEIRKSFIELYNESIDFAITLVSLVNSYLYDNSITIDSIEKGFMNLSYDTGIECTDKRGMTFTRKYESK